jgi:hypothetical protein
VPCIAEIATTIVAGIAGSAKCYMLAVSAILELEKYSRLPKIYPIS